MTYEYILNSSKPDREIEYFWCTFKDSIIKFLSDEEKKEIQHISDTLNELQKEEKYNQIEDYISSHIVKIGYIIIQLDDFYKAHLLDTNIKRWKKISKNSIDIYNDNNTFYCLFKLYLNLKSKETPIKNIIIEELKKYALTKDLKILDSIMNIAIKNQIYGIIDKIKNLVDIHKFLNTTDQKIITNIKTIKGDKLLKHLAECSS